MKWDFTTQVELPAWCPTIGAGIQVPIALFKNADRIIKKYSNGAWETGNLQGDFHHSVCCVRRSERITGHPPTTCVCVERRLLADGGIKRFLCHAVNQQRKAGYGDRGVFSLHPLHSIKITIVVSLQVYRSLSDSHF